ncbi:MAG TPA: phospholipase D family protein [Eoetvoesiella sp.]|uniref:phospholipase D family protein n=1 Tax=Eoetvoesiella sp. TaxID=1966355 RepID=UPI002C10F71F|nr:phospholipase D family protein [Eoetvoesiella sp.]HWK62361.1 phospholipase D family protein [Eoetvoesiella sp.]
MKPPKRSVLYLPLIGLATMLIGGCVTAPSLQNRPASHALSVDESRATTLGRAEARLAAAHPGKTGIHMLSNAHEAFAARALLARAAQRTLDIQYYIWHKDLTGTLLFQSLNAAANRGVRVRLLLDDLNTSGLDPLLAALDANPNIEVRLFNPFFIRAPRWINYLSDFSRLNRRMHNKSFTADNQVTIVGGRNIGDEYFGATDDMVFADLDVLAIGPVVKDVSDSFDSYWSSLSSYPSNLLLPAANPALLRELANDAATLEQDPRARPYLQAVEGSGLIRQLRDGTIDLQWADTKMVSDDPRKGLNQAPASQLLPSKLERIVGRPRTDLELVSSYFVPTAAGVDSFTAMARRGVQIKILTNSLDATDVAAVHAGYAKWRKPLLEAGIKLYEMRRLSPASQKRERTGRFGISGTSLHAKTFSVDGSRIFVGSFNFDPRSAKLNTELGFVIDSPVLAHAIAKAFDDKVPEVAYEVHLTDTGDLYWTEEKDGKEIRHDTEPNASLWRRLVVNFLSLLPIDWML